MSLSTLEQQIVTEWGVIRSFVALHPYITIAAMVIAGWALGHLHIPV